MYPNCINKYNHKYTQVQQTHSRKTTTCTNGRQKLYTHLKYEQEKTDGFSIDSYTKYSLCNNIETFLFFHH